MSEHFNEVMPETTDLVLCMRIVRPITADGYRHNLLDRLDQMIATHGEIRLLVHYDRYAGWEEDAARNNMATLPEYGPKIRRMALVNPPKSAIIDAKVKQPLLKGEVQIFSADALADALEWVSS